MSAVTQWFEIDVDGQPTRPGEYECQYCESDSIYTWFWNGSKWLYHFGAPTEFGNVRTEGEKWRGLAEEPK